MYLIWDGIVYMTSSSKDSKPFWLLLVLILDNMCWSVMLESLCVVRDNGCVDRRG